MAMLMALTGEARVDCLKGKAKPGQAPRSPARGPRAQALTGHLTEPSGPPFTLRPSLT